MSADTPTTLDVLPLISGTGTLAVRIASAPGNGAATVSGTRITYTPNSGYIGPDSFTYESFNGTASSPPATVTVLVVSRTDPSLDPNVIGLVGAQTQTFRRFARAQIANFQQRL